MLGFYPAPAHSSPYYHRNNNYDDYLLTRLAEQQSSYAAALARERQAQRRRAALRHHQGYPTQFFTPSYFDGSVAPDYDYEQPSYDEELLAQRAQQQRRQLAEQQRARELSEFLHAQKMAQEQQRRAQEDRRRLELEHARREWNRARHDAMAEGLDDLWSHLGASRRYSMYEVPEQRPASVPISSEQPVEANGQARPQSQPSVETEPVATAPPAPSPTDLEGAATTIQTAYRAHLARRAALSSIATVATQFDTLRASFVFPTSLDFAPSNNAVENATPKLAYTAHNTPVHAHEDALLKLLQALDAVESGGDERVRSKRRALARSIERELSVLDEKKAEVWKAMFREEQIEVDVQQFDESGSADMDVKVEVEGQAQPQSESEVAPIDTVVNTTLSSASPTSSGSNQSVNELDGDIEPEFAVLKAPLDHTTDDALPTSDSINPAVNDTSDDTVLTSDEFIPIPHPPSPVSELHSGIAELPDAREPTAISLPPSPTLSPLDSPDTQDWVDSHTKMDDDDDADMIIVDQALALPPPLLTDSSRHDDDHVDTDSAPTSDKPSDLRDLAVDPDLNTTEDSPGVPYLLQSESDLNHQEGEAMEMDSGSESEFVVV